MVPMRAVVKSKGKSMYPSAQPIVALMCNVTRASQLTSRSLRFLNRKIAMRTILSLQGGCGH